MAALVFISYASGDHDRARVILEDLESDGISCWMASRDILGSEDYARVIPPAVADAKVFLLVLSASSIASVHVYREVHLATDDKKPILPVRVDPIESVEGDLKFSLAGTQWVDATPRLQAALPGIRSEVRRLLALTGVTVKPLRRSPFERVLASAFAWTVVVMLTGLLVHVMQIYWINLVPWPEVLLEVTHHPVTFVAALAPPLVAIGTQFMLHRRARSMLTLDALFAAAPKAAVARTAIAFGLLALLVLVAVLGPPTISFSKTTPVPGAEQDAEISRARQCSTVGYEVSSHYYEATLRIGRFNPPGNYAIRLNLISRDPDHVDFCDIWANPQLIQGDLESLKSQPGDTLDNARTTYIEVRRPKDVFGASTRIGVTLIHTQRAPPENPVEGIATAGRVGQWHASSRPLPILASDWR
jgi:hypothetical protein